jgi:hypothetical protein
MGDVDPSTGVGYNKGDQAIWEQTFGPLDSDRAKQTIANALRTLAELRGEVPPKDENQE